MNLLSTPANISSKDASLREDMRLLGHILGDTLRAQEGNETFEFVESVRRDTTQIGTALVVARFGRRGAPLSDQGFSLCGFVHGQERLHFDRCGHALSS